MMMMRLRRRLRLLGLLYTKKMITKQQGFKYTFPINVFPVPGGPNKSKPLGGFLSPLNNSGLNAGIIIVLCNIFLASSKPAMSSLRRIN